ncbi:MAG TPA: dihydrofolate reductase [Chryseosolibacter sp.]|nr:dihydrofolate reductase [Chryseosolibacter sp.]
MIVSAIAAVSKNGVIGRDNDLPWKLPDDMKFFMETTKSHHVIMGRKNYDSLPSKFKPLPNRINIVITRQEDFEAPHCIVLNDVTEAINIAESAGETELFVIGGAEIYKLTMEQTDRLYLTEIDAVVEGDTYFPNVDKNKWKEVLRKHHDKDERHAYAFDFVIYDRIKS